MEKIYYSITEVAEILKEVPHTLRLWEKSYGLKIKRSREKYEKIEHTKNRKATGIRQYTQANIDELKNIQHLRRQEGFTTKGAKAKLNFRKSDIEKIVNAIDTLEKTREELLKIRHDLNQLQAFAESVVI
jgi:DNA-binding transcriptional MerR regulator